MIRNDDPRRLEILEEEKWNVCRAARRIGITHQAFRSWLRYRGIKRPGGPGEAGRPKR